MRHLWRWPRWFLFHRHELPYVVWEFRETLQGVIPGGDGE